MKIGSIVGAVTALTVAISLALKVPATKETRQSVTSLAPLAEGEINFSH